MLRPVGSQPPSVYWRRRLLLAGSLVLVLVLIVVTIKAATSSGSSAGSGGQAAAATRSSTPVSARPSSARPSSPTAQHSPSSKASTSTSTSTSPSATGSSTTPPTCTSADLAVVAVVAKSAYKVGDTPMLELQVTNTGATPCVQDLADKQIVLKVYNGESRVWGSHDCEVRAGTQVRTLAMNEPVRVSITWSGLTSQPGNCSSRQRVGAGTYTLYATLSGKTGKVAQFTMS